MKISYDKMANAIYIHFRKGSFVANKELAGGIILDIGKNNTILGMEVLNARKRIGRLGIKNLEKMSQFVLQ